MLELADRLLSVLDAGRSVAVATVTHVDGSAPRALGTAMAVDDEGCVIGSLSGGCVEGAVVDVASRALETGDPQVAEFGIGDEDGFGVGLSCGGRIEVSVVLLTPAGGTHPLSDAVRGELEAAAAGRAAGVSLIVDGPCRGALIAAAHDVSEAVGLMASSRDRHVARRVLSALRTRVQMGRSAADSIECAGLAVRVAHLVAATRPRLIIFGAVDFSAALAAAAALLGYHVTICDARSLFTTRERFPAADEVVVAWPSRYLAETRTDPRTVLAVLTHDDKFDIPLLELALRMPVAYVGAMGSRSTHERRVVALRDGGLGEAELRRLHSPIGLDLGGSTPEETAVSILAEVIASRTQSSSAPLTSTVGPIHAFEAAAEVNP